MFYFKIQFQAVCQLVLWFAENMFWVHRQREQLQKETPGIAQNKKLESSLGQMGFRNTPLNQSSLWFIFNQTVRLWCLWGGIHNELLELKQARKNQDANQSFPIFTPSEKPVLCPSSAGSIALPSQLCLPQTSQARAPLEHVPSVWNLNGQLKIWRVEENRKHKQKQWLRCVIIIRVKKKFLKNITMEQKPGLMMIILFQERKYELLFRPYWDPCPEGSTPRAWPES